MNCGFLSHHFFFFSIFFLLQFYYSSEVPPFMHIMTKCLRGVHLNSDRQKYTVSIRFFLLFLTPDSGYKSPPLDGSSV